MTNYCLGLLWFLSFLPAVFAQNEDFVEHIVSTLPVILTGTQDQCHRYFYDIEG
jgi:hypothetical protein